MAADLVLVLSEGDDVGVARRPVPSGTRAAGVAARSDIPVGHKMALRDLPAGAPVRKYGQIIGFASVPIRAGDHVHVHNLESRDFDRRGEIGAEARPLPPPDRLRTFPGFLREDGRVGTRNYVAVIATVNCAASVARLAAERFRGPDFRRAFPHVDGVVAFCPKGGCIEPPGEPKRILRRVTAGFARHPNVFGFVMIGLGCEGNSIGLLREEIGPDPGPSAVFLTIQETGGVRKAVEAAEEAIRKILPRADAQRRTPQPAGRLVLALNCGGSDGASGITANPALGVASDLLVRQGGTSVLAETTEIYGAEHLLVRRAASREVGEKLGEIVRWWQEHIRQHRAGFDSNPSPGNKEGGLTTIYEKSLGAVAKAGRAPLSAVYRYAERVEGPGLCFMDTPGYDPVSLTGLAAGGCTICGFTTGRGSVFGIHPVPCLRIASNTPLWERLSEDMDLNAGTILDGTETVEEAGMRIFEKILAVAGGERTKGELAGIGGEEFAPWTLGPTF